MSKRQYFDSAEHGRYYLIKVYRPTGRHMDREMRRYDVVRVVEF